MSKNSKQRNKAEFAKAFTEARKNGRHGPKKTDKKTGKVNTWFSGRARKVVARPEVNEAESTGN